MKYPHACVLVMSKAPVPGEVKTRLIPLLGATAAAKFYQTLLDQLLAGLYTASLCPLELHCAPDRQHEFFNACRNRYSLKLAKQVTGDLGRRMSHAVQQALRYADRVVVIGADCPTLEAADIDAALRLLAGEVDVVLGPAEDGGYYLVGMKSHHPKIFEGIPWSSSRVLECTQQRIADLGLSCRQLVSRRDIDTPADYRSWQESRGVAHTQ